MYSFNLIKKSPLTLLYQNGIVIISRYGIFRRMVMKKTVTFTDKDKTLVERLEKYKKVKGYKSLIQVVRDLCDDALTLKEISK